MKSTVIITNQLAGPKRPIGGWRVLRVEYLGKSKSKTTHLGVVPRGAPSVPDSIAAKLSADELARVATRLQELNRQHWSEQFHRATALMAEALKHGASGAR